MDGLTDRLLANMPGGLDTGSSVIGGIGAGSVIRSAQQTLKNAIGCVGTGLHSGRRIALRLLPAEPGSGIVFRRVDGAGVEIPARHDLVADTRLCTVLTHPDHPEMRIGTVEHVMAALAGSGIDNAVVELDGPEVPILDGSAEPFMFLIACAGVAVQDAALAAIEILRPVRVQDGESFAELRPTGMPGLAMACSIAFAAPAIGRQACSLVLSPDAFRTELARARTFTLAAEVDGLRAAGLALGGSLDNAVVVDHDRILNPGGLRAPDEFVRHKMLDAVGDLALAGAPLMGRFVSHRGGHGMNNKVLRALFADPTAWRVATPALPEWMSVAA